MENQKYEKYGLVMLVFAVTTLEFALAESAWHTIGEIAVAFFLLLLILNIVPLITAFLSYRKATFFFLLPTFLLIVPLNCFLLLHWFNLNRQAHNIIAWAKTTKSQTGRYPANLSRYATEFGKPSTDLKYFADGESFELTLVISSDDTPHIYYSGESWWYYPD